MTTPNEFKFDCPECGQHIQAAREWSGRKINCPVCKKLITIPPPPESPKADVPSVSSKPVMPPPSKPAGSPTLAKPPEKAAPEPAEKVAPAPVAHPAPASPSPTVAPIKQAEPPSVAKPAATAAVRKEPEALRVAVLTPAIKLEMVRAVRRRIADESNWLPGKINGSNAYAAKAGGSENELVNVKDPAAARFSLIGAFELEFHLRNVITTAKGRADLLNDEIPGAVREVLRNEMSEEQAQTKGTAVKADVMTISHAQCLAALDVLEENYSQTMSEARAEKIERRMDNIRLPDLVKKLEARAKIPAEDVATTLYHELMDVRRRLERLESRTIQGKKDE